MAEVTIPEHVGRFLILDITEEEATEKTQVGTTFTTKLTGKFYVAVAGVYTFFACYRTKASVGGDTREALARLNIDSGAETLAQVNRASTSYGYDSASEEASGSLSVGWHTLEVQIANENVADTTYLQGVFVVFGLSL